MRFTNPGAQEASTTYFFRGFDLTRLFNDTHANVQVACFPNSTSIKYHHNKHIYNDAVFDTLVPFSSPLVVTLISLLSNAPNRTSFLHMSIDISPAIRALQHLFKAAITF